MLAVGYLCFSRPDEIPSIPLDWFGIPTDKIAHFVMFTPFPILASLAFIPEKYGKFRKVLGIIAIAALGAVTAAATEQIQEVLGYRCYETKDMMIETVKYLNSLDIQGVKIHMLHILKNTKLGEIELPPDEVS